MATVDPVPSTFGDSPAAVIAATACDAEFPTRFGTTTGAGPVERYTVTNDPAVSALPAAGIVLVTEFTGTVAEYSDPMETVKPAAVNVAFALASV